VIQTCDSTVSHDTHAVVDRFRRVVKNGVEIRFGGKSKASSALLATIVDKVGSIGERTDTRYDAL
jgi:hypothetical protein